MVYVNDYPKRMDRVQGRLIFFYEKCLERVLKQNFIFTKKRFYIGSWKVTQEELDEAVKGCPHLDGLESCNIEMMMGRKKMSMFLFLNFKPDWFKQALGLNHHQYDEYMETLKIKRKQERWVKRIANVHKEVAKDEAKRNNKCDDLHGKEV